MAYFRCRPQTIETVTINVDLMSNVVAPVYARLTVDLTGAGFSATKDYSYATGVDFSDKSYCPEAHEIVHEWQFEEEAGNTWPALTGSRIRKEFADKGYAMGYRAFMAWDTPGLKTIRYKGTEPLTGKVRYGSAQILVGSFDSVYSGPRVVAVNLDGDSDFTGAPAGCQTLNLGPGQTFADSAAWANNKANDNTAFLFKRGVTYQNGRVAISAAQSCGDNLFFGAYGSGARPILMNDGRHFDMGGRAATDSDFRLVGLALNGSYNDKDVVVNTDRDILDLVNWYNTFLYDCTSDGKEGGLVTAGSGFSDHNKKLAVANCYFTGWGGQYGLFTNGGRAGVDGQWQAFFGNRLVDRFDRRADDITHKSIDRKSVV